jgi:hypothetical protein
MIINEEPLLDEGEEEPSEETICFLKRIEGECKLTAYRYLTLSYWKIVGLCVPLALTIVGLIFIAHFKKLRLQLVYSALEPHQAGKASHIYC